MLEDSAPWAGVRWITMEYYLWAKPGAAHETPTEILRSLGFRTSATALGEHYSPSMARKLEGR